MQICENNLSKRNTNEMKIKLKRIPYELLKELTKEWLGRYKPEIQLANEFEKYNLLDDCNMVFSDLSQQLINSIINEWWKEGFNMDQIAELDILGIICEKSNVTWITSSIIDSDMNEISISLNQKVFFDSLKNELGKFYPCNIAEKLHPHLPLRIFRIQIFEQYNSSISSHKPYFISIPLYHCRIFHSPQNDIHSMLILQCIKTSLLNDDLRLRLENYPPLKSLTLLNNKYGTAIYNSCEGPWNVYENEIIEPSPLSNPEFNKIVTGKKLYYGDLTQDKKMEKSMIRFKGSKHGTLAKKRYLDKRFHQRFYKLEDNNVGITKDVSRYESLIPVRNVNFSIKRDEFLIKITLAGNDVFGGIHELCDKDVLELDRLPGWLTGEHGDNSGYIENGIFRKSNRGGII